MVAQADFILIPVYAKDGTIHHAKVSPRDAGLAVYRWRLVAGGYAYRSVSGTAGSTKKNLPMHREVLGLDFGDGLMADHINGDKLDNRRENLRAVTNRENQQNRRGPSRLNSTGLRGVSKGTGGRFRAYCGSTYLGQFATAELAAKRALDARAEAGYLSNEPTAARFMRDGGGA